MSVVDASLAGAVYPLHALHEVVLVVHLDVVCVQSDVNYHPYQLSLDGTEYVLLATLIVLQLRTLQR